MPRDSPKLMLTGADAHESPASHAHRLSLPLAPQEADEVDPEVELPDEDDDDDDDEATLPDDEPSSLPDDELLRRGLPLAAGFPPGEPCGACAALPPPSLPPSPPSPP